jgi:hypothetical protein
VQLGYHNTLQAKSLSQIIYNKIRTRDHIRTVIGQYSDNYDATMRPMRQTLVLIPATTVAVGLSVLQPATVLTYGSVNLCNENNKCTCMKNISLRD